MRELLARLLSAFRRSRREQDLDAEIAAHLKLAIDDLVSRGVDPREARRLALAKFGGVEAAREQHREARGLPWADRLAQDLRYALHTMRREPAFTLFAVAIAALGIAAATTVFSVLSTLLLRPLPFSQPGRLVWVANAPPENGLSDQTLQVRRFLSFRNRNHSFADMAAYFAFYEAGDSTLDWNGRIERLNVLPVSQNFFPLLGVKPEIGRGFNTQECQWNGPKAALLSHGLWVRRFASDPHIVGRTIPLDDSPVTVVGVLPASFDFGAVFAPGIQMDLYVPFPLTDETDHWGNTLAVVGRLKPGVTVPSAQAEATVLGQLITREPHRGNDITPQLTPLKQHVSGRLRPALLTLAFAVVAVMLIVCANLSNLLLVRGAARQKEFAIRSALGAGRARLARQVLTESLLLALLAAAVGSCLAWLGTRALAGLTAFNVPLLSSVRLDWTALAFTIALAVFSGVVFGLAPALHVPRGDLGDALKEQSRAATDSRRHGTLRAVLVVAEIAFASVLLVGTGLLIRSFLRVLDVNLGFQPARAAAMRIDLPSQFTQANMTKTAIARRDAYFNDVLGRVRSLPGVKAAGIIDSLPLGRNRTWGIAAHGMTYKPNEYPEAFVHIVSDGYIPAAGIRIIEGRDFTERDTTETEPAIVINETLARRLFRGEEALGRQVDAGPFNTPCRVIGIASDVRHLALEQASGSEMYFTLRQVHDLPSIYLVLRSRLAAAALTSAVRQTLLPLDPEMPREQFESLTQLVDRSVSPRRFIVLLLAGFAAFALILASLGIYAVVSYSVGQRKQEIGIRMALGASPGALQNGILRETLRLAAIGLALGALVSAALTQSIQGLLYGIRPEDPVTFLGVIALMLAVAALAGYLPARRASHIDPMIALRAE